MIQPNHSTWKPAADTSGAVLPAPGRNGEDPQAQIYIIWSGTTGGENRVVGFARNMPDALNTMASLAPQASASNDEIRRDWPCPGATEILRTWFDKESRVTRWLRATPTFHALDSKHLRLYASSSSLQI